MTKKLISIYDFRDWKVELLELFAECLIILALSLWNNGAFVFTELKEKKKKKKISIICNVVNYLPFSVQNYLSPTAFDLYVFVYISVNSISRLCHSTT